MIMRELFAIIIIPTDFERNILQGKNITVPVFGDATNRLASGQIQQELSKAYQELLGGYNTRILQDAGYTPEQASLIISPIQSETVAMYNPVSALRRLYSWSAGHVITALPADSLCACQYRGAQHAER